jgi:hypothetical protein
LVGDANKDHQGKKQFFFHVFDVAQAAFSIKDGTKLGYLLWNGQAPAHYVG